LEISFEVATPKEKEAEAWDTSVADTAITGTLSVANMQRARFFQKIDSFRKILSC
jgi:hypothetical protein